MSRQQEKHAFPAAHANGFLASTKEKKSFWKIKKLYANFNKIQNDGYLARSGNAIMSAVRMEEHKVKWTHFFFNKGEK